MSLLVSLFINDAIIMASDSRTTYKTSTSIRYVDKTYKTVLMDGKIGISHCLNAEINGKSIDYHLQNFMQINKGRGLTRIPELLKNYFINLKSDCVIEFFVCGYINNTRYGYRINTQDGITKLNTTSNHLYWAGNKTISTRLFYPDLYIKKNSKYVKHSFSPLRLDEFTLTDGIDFVEFMINTVEKVMSYQNCDQNIGGPVDILIIKPSFAYWHKRK